MGDTGERQHGGVGGHLLQDADRGGHRKSSGHANEGGEQQQVLLCPLLACGFPGPSVGWLLLGYTGNLLTKR